MNERLKITCIKSIKGYEGYFVKGSIYKYEEEDELFYIDGDDGSTFEFEKVDFYEYFGESIKNDNTKKAVNIVRELENVINDNPTFVITVDKVGTNLLVNAILDKIEELGFEIVKK